MGLLNSLRCCKLLHLSAHEEPKKLGAFRMVRFISFYALLSRKIVEEVFVVKCFHWGTKPS
jgi:hypothetical protein